MYFSSSALEAGGIIHYQCFRPPQQNEVTKYDKRLDFFFLSLFSLIFLS